MDATEVTEHNTAAIRRASLVAQMVKNLPAMFHPWVGKIPWMEKTLESPLDCKEIQPVHPKPGTAHSPGLPTPMGEGC